MWQVIAESPVDDNYDEWISVDENVEEAYRIISFRVIWMMKHFVQWDLLIGLKTSFHCKTGFHTVTSFGW